jgi:hypothetical protein
VVVSAALPSCSLRSTTKLRANTIGCPPVHRLGLFGVAITFRLRCFRGGHGRFAVGGVFNGHGNRRDKESWYPGEVDTGESDTGESDTGESDTGEPDTGDVETGEPDTGEVDTGEPDTGEPDTGEYDAGEPDTGESDTGVPSTVRGDLTTVYH